jgi:hypothetical protein
VGGRPLLPFLTGPEVPSVLTPIPTPAWPCYFCPLAQAVVSHRAQRGQEVRSHQEMGKAGHEELGRVWDQTVSSGGWDCSYPVL